MMIAPAIRCAAARVSLVETTVSAAVAGTVTRIAVIGTAQVDGGDLIVVIE